MSYIEAINQAATASAQSKTDNADKKNDIMGKQDFLTLLVAQLQNQDPLNPDDPTEFTAQLAQFSSLEQLFNLNESMDNVAASVGDSQKLSALSMIGKEVTYADSEFKYEGKPVQVGYSLDGDAKDVSLLLQQNGVTVATLKGTELSQGDHFITWNGLTQNGQPAPIGDYTIVIQASAASGTIAAAPLVRSEVTGVDLDGSSGGLLYTKGGEVSVTNIKGVYEIGTGLNQEGEDEQAGAPIVETSSDPVADEPTDQTNSTLEETLADITSELTEDTVPTEG